MSARPDDTYVFIDGAWLVKRHRHVMQQFFGVEGELDLSPILQQANASRAYYYDAIDYAKGTNESDTEWEARVLRQEYFFRRIQNIPDFHVRPGSVSRGKKREQKEVDVAVAVDMVTHGLKGDIARAVLIAGDLDFRPALEALVRMGVNVELWYHESSFALDLPYAADKAIGLRFRQLYSWNSKSFQAAHPIPADHHPAGGVEGELVRVGSVAGKSAELRWVELRRQSDQSLLKLFSLWITIEPGHTARISDVDPDLIERYVAAQHSPIVWETGPGEEIIVSEWRRKTPIFAQSQVPQKEEAEPHTKQEAEISVFATSAARRGWSERLKRQSQRKKLSGYQIISYLQRGLTTNEEIKANLSEEFVKGFKHEAVYAGMDLNNHSPDEGGAIAELLDRFIIFQAKTLGFRVYLCETVLQRMRAWESMPGGITRTEKLGEAVAASVRVLQEPKAKTQLGGAEFRAYKEAIVPELRLLMGQVSSTFGSQRREPSFPEVRAWIAKQVGQSPGIFPLLLPNLGSFEDYLAKIERKELPKDEVTAERFAKGLVPPAELFDQWHAWRTRRSPGSLHNWFAKLPKPE